MHFADSWANFCNFLTIFFVLLPLMGIEETPITSEMFKKEVVSVLWIRSIF